MKNKLSISCLLAALGIGIGAFGAHGLESRLVANGHVDTWETAVFYHLIHAVALFVLAVVPGLKSRWTFPLWCVGILLFSGSLYVLSLTGVGILGAITPFGGGAFIAGWIALTFENKR